MVDVLIPSFLEVPFTTIINRIDDGSRGLLQLTTLLSEQHDLQEKDILYALKVGRSNVFDHEIEASTTERMLGFYKNYYLYLYKANMQHHKDYSEQILLNLEQLKSKRGSRVIHTKQSIQQDLKSVSIAKENLDKAKKVLNKAKADHLRAVDKLCGLEKTLAEFQRISEEKAKEAITRDSVNKFSVGRMFSQAFESNPEQDRDRQIRKVEKRKNEVLAARQGILQRRKELLDAYRLLDENYLKSSLLFQDMELERMYTLKNTFKSFCDLEKQFLNHRLELLKTLEEAVNMQQPEEDVALYISQAKQAEWTHKYCHALGLLEERLKDRWVA
ncbi:hypothetical protein EON65_17220 [archaeon]|nr:MAG: hypothetical protein EON65_17220 [archaeon]